MDINSWKKLDHVTFPLAAVPLSFLVITGISECWERAVSSQWAAALASLQRRDFPCLRQQHHVPVFSLLHCSLQVKQAHWVTTFSIVPGLNRKTFPGKHSFSLFYLIGAPQDMQKPNQTKPKNNPGFTCIAVQECFSSFQPLYWCYSHSANKLSVGTLMRAQSSLS